MKRQLIIAMIFLSLSAAIAAQTPAPVRFDAEKATEAWLAKMPADQRARSDAYFEGGYWLLLWNFLFGAAVSALLLFTRVSAKMQSLAERVTRWKNVHTFVYWIEYVILTTVVSFPLTWYQGFVREHKYDLSNQTFGAWFGDQMKGLAVGLVLGGLALVAMYAILRRATERWWIYGSVAAFAFILFAVLVSPVYIAPMFNRYTPLTDSRVREPILAMAHANGITSDDVYVMDASRQTKRVSANVSGLFGTERVTLNDNLLNRTSLPEIKAVMAHEIGHYALGHIYSGLIFFEMVIIAVFAFLFFGSRWAIAKWGTRWGVASVADPASLPLIVLLGSIAFFILTPVTNTITRVQESQADIFGLNAAREPDGFAAVSLKLGEYRKLAPGPVEEFVFFDHPSGRNRILMAMKWKAAQMAAQQTDAPLAK